MLPVGRPGTLKDLSALTSGLSRPRSQALS
jgi:hypothetical protein